MISPIPALGVRRGNGALIVSTSRGDVVIKRVDFARFLASMCEGAAREDLDMFYKITSQRRSEAAERAHPKTRMATGA